jgi:hypothetical protein
MSSAFDPGEIGDISSFMLSDRIYDLPYRDRDGNLLDVAAVLRNITKRFEEIKALRRALAYQPIPLS